MSHINNLLIKAIKNTIYNNYKINKYYNDYYYKHIKKYNLTEIIKRIMDILYFGFS